MRMDPDQCVPLRDTYEVFTELKKALLVVSGKPGFRVVDNPDLYNGFTRSDSWTGGAATKKGEWLLFLATNDDSGWFSIHSCRPEGTRECDAEEWRNEIIEWLECFYGFRFRTHPRVE
jgi:hypothetical protein